MLKLKNNKQTLYCFLVRVSPSSIDQPQPTAGNKKTETASVFHGESENRTSNPHPASLSPLEAAQHQSRQVPG